MRRVNYAVSRAIGKAAGLYARALGGRTQWIDGIRVCTDVPSWAYPRGGVCWGDSVVTGSDPRLITHERIRHEKVHRDQWRRYGLAFPALYFAAGTNPLTNKYEREAGLGDGGYTA